MLGIIVFAVGIMYTPGPVNILSLNSGAHSHFRSHIPFCTGVGTALFFYFFLIGYTGSLIINENVIPVIAGVGVCFILHLAYKILSSRVEDIKSNENNNVLKFKDGLLMQLLNPKSMLVVLPVATIQFPAVGIEGFGIAIWSIILGIIGIGAPLAYAIFGTYVSKYISGVAYLRVMNILMGLMLVAVALEMGYAHVYLALK